MKTFWYRLTRVVLEKAIESVTSFITYTNGIHYRNVERKTRSATVVYLVHVFHCMK